MIRLQAKDMRIASKAMESVGAPHDGTALTTRLFNEAAEASFGADGTQALVRFLGWDD
jgi:3-hydroxyisobutyrate dehydrogenase-like beta-hydroxyacid dehydrogenase